MEVAASKNAQLKREEYNDSIQLEAVIETWKFLPSHLSVSSAGQVQQDYQCTMHSHFDQLNEDQFPKGETLVVSCQHGPAVHATLYGSYEVMYLTKMFPGLLTLWKNHNITKHRKQCFHHIIS